ncbi:MAG: recombinase RecA [Planctomycetota bacterium]|nr:MAG: recombinase RecA [Planctomycetota bacterium]
MSGPADQAGRVRRDALARLARRPMSRARLAAALIARWGDERAVSEVLDSLARAGLIDDRAFADEAIRQALAEAPAAEAYLVARLVGLGVDEALARQRAAAALANHDEDADARALARECLARAPESLPIEARLRRVAGRLARRGYDEETVRSALDGLSPG